MKYVLLLFFIFHIAISSYGQKAAIKGHIIDETNEPLPAALILAQSTSDTTSQFHTFSNFDGAFDLPLPFGVYTLKISFIAFQPKTIKAIVVDEEILDLGTIPLEPSIETLTEVDITADRQQISLQIDKKVYRVDENTTNSGGTATEVLENIPSIAVDVEGNISLRGSENVRILVDGKPSGLIGNDNSGLSQIPASMIDNIEIITNPSSRYDAQGDVGIINIVLKKELQQGLNGSFEGTLGYPTSNRASINLNYRTKHINLFGSTGVFNQRRPGTGSTFQKFYSGDSVFYYQKSNERERGGLGLNINIGTDWYINDKNTLTVTGLYRTSNGDNFSINTYEDFDGNNTLMNISRREDNELETKKTIEGALNYEKTFDRKKQKLVFQTKVFESDDRENSNIEQTFSESPDSLLLQKSSNTEDEFNFLSQIDYNHPINDHGNFETGAKSSIRQINNDFSVSQKDENGEEIPLGIFNNDFRYDEAIHAVYAQYGTKHKKTAYQLGLRGEYTAITTTLLKTNEINKRTYLNIFPSLFISTEIDSNSTLQFSYSRRISRPRFRHLLPFYSFQDNRNFYTGNPNLNPVFTHSFEIGYLRYLKKGSILPSLYYRNNRGVINRITISDSLGITQTLPVNLATENAFGFELSGNYDITKHWKCNGSFNLYYSTLMGQYESLVLNQNTFMFTGQFSSKIDIGKKSAFQTQFHYRSPRRTTQGLRKSIYSIDLALSREFFNKKAELVLSVRDLLNSRRWRNVVDTEEYYLESDYQRQRRQFTLSFVYHLKTPKRDKGNRKGGNGSNGFGGDDF